jgi:tetratricopeptide (TPR) repeat protein
MKVGGLLLICFFSISFACAQIDLPAAAKQELNLGVQAYRAARYEEAIEHFSRAVQYDPDLPVGRLYLATAYAQIYVPGVDTTENVANANAALEQYAQILRNDPSNMPALKGTAYINLQLKKFQAAREAYKKAAEIDPKDPEPFYSVGVVDWMLAYKDIATEKDKLNHEFQTSEDEDDAADDTATREAIPSNDQEYRMIFSSACVRLRTEHLSDVEDGIAMETRAIDLRKDYDDAMAYLSLLFRERADLQCGDAAAHAADNKKADQWTNEAMAARQKKAEEAAHRRQAPTTSSPE